ncbi:alpha-N-acetylglucosaminidase-like isoform X2 [Paramacrobiotus metropolitanus]|uniref:alpha-N-acetylglucosaminidase-like isoform X2 n=1 Tax=Paramacrobiotus metropolitanus TaxID=2943436 RepID=UPI0024459AC7|nr:alpha-N-acetylglucosaminidase-like isoform X2 [Paramacrobiotus metropolitanus]
MTKLLDEPLTPSPNANMNQQGQWRYHGTGDPALTSGVPESTANNSYHANRSRANLLEQSIREEPEDDDLCYFPLPAANPAPRSKTGTLHRLGDKVLHLTQRGYGSFPLPRGRGAPGGGHKFVQFSDRVLPLPAHREGCSKAKLGFVAVVVLIILGLTVGIIVEMRAGRHDHWQPSLSASSAASSQFPELRQQILRTKHFVSAESQENTVRDMVNRLLPREQADLFTFSVVPSAFDDPALDTANISSVNGTVRITGNSGTACSFAFYHFLKYYCGAHISWSARQLQLPAILPDVSVIVKKADLLHYYQNVCTSSYSFVWWNWTRWEEEIDWMALQGINFPLAFTGQEEIWRRVYTRLGLTEEELDGFFVGPAFLAWGRMGNIRAWGGPLPRQWMDEQVQLQHQILARMQSFGMIPILPAFSGIVPVSLLRLYPKLNMTRMTNWAGFPDDLTGSYFLDPHEVLFGELADLFITEMNAEYKYTSHFYNVDTFNEQKPRDPSGWDAEFIRETIAVSYAGMRQADPNAFWVMQAWMLTFDTEFWTPDRTAALLTAIPTGRLIMLDLYAEVLPTYNTTRSFYGQPFIWCMLHNFGGVLGLYGRLTSVSTGPPAARQYVNTSMVGVGISPEGINQNDMIYEFMNEMAWRTQIPDVDKWVAAYTERRYGGETRDGQRAYHVLRTSVWECPASIHDNGQYTITRRPRFGLWEPMWYEPDQVFTALDMLLEQSSTLPKQGAPGFLYDMVDVTRQTLQIAFAYFYQNLEQAYSDKRVDRVVLYGEALELILLDLSSVLSLHPSFQLTPWIEAAKSWARGENQTEFYQWNALNQISVWGPHAQILDYATKQWSGVVAYYYQPRWRMFIDEVVASLAGEKAFNQTAFDQRVYQDVELVFTYSNPSDLAVAEDQNVADFDNIVHQARSLHRRYQDYRSPEFLERLSSKRSSRRRNGTQRTRKHHRE